MAGNEPLRRIGEKFVDDANYVYSCDNTTATKKYLRCVQSSGPAGRCRGRLNVNLNLRGGILTHSHNHQPDAGIMDKHNLMEYAVRKAKTTTLPPKRIYDAACRR